MNAANPPSPAAEELTALVLNEARERFPLVERPYVAVIGARLGITGPR